MQNLTGQTIDRYHILEQIGEGGMAVVYKAYDTRLEREVAIKIIRKEAFPPEALDRIFKRFEREAKALARMSHPNVVKVHDYGEFDGSPYLVMEYQPGGTLKAILGKPLDWSDVSQLLIPIANALGYAHQEGIFHRDVKPSNILITKQGEPMLTDFGIAKILEKNEGHTLTGTGLGVGTPEYMAPEQGLGKEVDGRVDIYALGVVLYELVTGRKPYTADTPLAVLIKHMADPLPRPGEVFPGISEELEKVILKALAKDPANRYQSMAEMAVAMGKVSEQAGGWRNRETLPTAHVILAQPEATIDEIQPVAAINTDSLVPGVKKTHGQMQDTGGKKTKPGQKFQWWQFALGGAILVSLFLLLRPAKSPMIPIVETPLPVITIGKATATEITEATQLNTSIPTSTPETTHTPKSILEIGSMQVSAVDGMVMSYVPEGNFIMGSTVDSAYAECQKHRNDCKSEWFENGSPPQTVYLDAYWIDITEVTNGMYRECVDEVGCTANYDYGSTFNGPQQPVVGVDWNQAKAYCTWAGRELPTEARWEKAARGEDGRTYPWGEGVDPTRANYAGNVGVTMDIGSYPNGASPYRILDMSGNVREWISDWYDASYYGKNLGSNPIGPIKGVDRVIRGGSWYDDETNLNSAFRGWYGPDGHNNGIGFRCVSNINSPSLMEIKSPSGGASSIGTVNLNPPLIFDGFTIQGNIVSVSNDWSKLLLREYVNNSRTYSILSSDPSKNLTLPYSDKMWYPVLSPDGEKIVYPTSSGLYVMNIPSGDIKQLENNSDQTWLSWSQDSQNIAFISIRDRSNEIYSIDIETKNVVRLTNNWIDEGSVTWSPEGKSIVYSALVDGNIDLFTLKIGTADSVRLTFDPAMDAGPHWSPDGKTIAFLSRPGGFEEIFLIDYDGSNRRRITNNNDYEYILAWSLDSTELAYQSNGVIQIIDVEGK